MSQMMRSQICRKNIWGIEQQVRRPRYPWYGRGILGTFNDRKRANEAAESDTESKLMWPKASLGFMSFDNGQMKNKRGKGR